MSDNKQKRQPQNQKGGEGKVPPRGWMLLIIIMGLIPLMMMMKEGSMRNQQEISHPKFVELVESNLIAQAEITYNPQSSLREISGEYIAETESGQATRIPFKIKTSVSEELETKLLQSGKFKPVEPNTFLMNILYAVLPILLLAGIIYFFLIRQVKMAGKGALSFGKSKARMMVKGKNKVTFKDVAGAEEAIDDVRELVDFLKDPKKFQNLGGRIPKGILMVGAPGTGKTLLAKAIAGEADAAFFSISGSDFVEMFVGVGASRVRDMFEQARQNSPCLVFVDEIDAVGRSRGHGMGGGNDEREQTLNALLVEMDGFDTQEGTILIAATNRPDVLDPALLRPGRFDRQIMINLPDLRGREEILKVHARRFKLKESVDLSVIARATPGYSGAELANLLNEAALQAARFNKKSISMHELEEARIKVRWGRERKSLAMTDDDKRHTAWHEAGHALVNVMLEHTHPLHKVTIIPRGQSLGSTMSLPEQEMFNRQRREMVDMITLAMAGRIAEEIESGDISTGASGDIQQATQLARAMVCQYGMSDRLGMVQYGESSEYVFLGRDMAKSKEYSEKTAQEIDDEVKRLIDECYGKAKTLLIDNRDKLEIIANALLEYESLDGTQVEEIAKTGKFTPPPTAGSDDSMKGEDSSEPLPESPKPIPPEIGSGLGSPAPAPL
ncbi:MAG: ATP-dependent zinc metalloprotease FtsH [Verrucomicrobia bacterium]|nr:ATP-dependent zinc metalloprotease FtsH [Verrucomicrobiota bacterium]MCF7708916.1 ATP-dependent zinc metalloprotease FtsH [Verrucomicrobiota bacterium]